MLKFICINLNARFYISCQAENTATNYINYQYDYKANYRSTNELFANLFLFINLIIFSGNCFLVYFL